MKQEKLGWTLVAKQLAGETGRVGRLKQLNQHTQRWLCLNEENQLSHQVTWVGRQIS